MKNETEALAVQQQEIQPGNMMEAFIKVSTTPGVSIDVIERMAALQERWEARQAEKSYAAALAELQSELPQIHKGGIIYKKGSTTEVRSRYALIEDVDVSLRPLLAKHGFSLSFDSESPDGKIYKMSAKLFHKDGYSETKTFLLPLDASEYRTNVQSIGSTLSYGKRQLIKMLFNMVEKFEDDDGQGGDGKISPEQARDLQCKIEEVGSTVPNFLKFIAGADKLENVLLRDLPRCYLALEAKRNLKK